MVLGFRKESVDEIKSFCVERISSIVGVPLNVDPPRVDDEPNTEVLFKFCELNNDVLGVTD